MIDLSILAERNSINDGQANALEFAIDCLVGMDNAMDNADPEAVVPQAVVKAAIVFLLDNFGESHERIRNRLDSGDLDALVLDTRRCILPRAVRGRGH